MSLAIFILEALECLEILVEKIGGSVILAARLKQCTEYTVLWMHYMADLAPNKNDATHKSDHWEKNHMPNLTGASFPYSPNKIDNRLK